MTVADDQQAFVTFQHHLNEQRRTSGSPRKPLHCNLRLTNASLGDLIKHALRYAGQDSARPAHICD